MLGPYIASSMSYMAYVIMVYNINHIRQALTRLGSNINNIFMIKNRKVFWKTCKRFEVTYIEFFFYFLASICIQHVSG